MLPVLLKQIVPCTLWTACSAYFLNKMFLILHEKNILQNAYFSNKLFCVLLEQNVLCTLQSKCCMYSSNKMFCVLLEHVSRTSQTKCSGYSLHEIFHRLRTPRANCSAYSSSKMFRVVRHAPWTKCFAYSMTIKVPFTSLTKSTRSTGRKIFKIYKISEF